MARRPRVLLNVLSLEDRTTPAAVADYLDGRVLVGFFAGQEQIGMASVSDPSVVTHAEHLGFGAYKLTLAPGVSVPAAMAALGGRAGVRYAEPDYRRYKADTTPNDPTYANGTLWGMHNTGQNGGKPDADIDAPEGWDFGTGTGTFIVAVLDDGVDYTHPDLAANMWTNPGEVPGDGIDNDGNGFIDDVFGADFSNTDGDPMPAAGDTHGTHVAGTIGAVGNNGIGVTGVAWKTRLMALNFLGSGPDQGSISAEVRGINYAIAKGAKILNGSFGGAGTNQAERDAFAAARAAGMVIVVAAGNDAANNDVNPYYPANFSTEYDNVITVAAINRLDQLANFSSYGKQSVTLGAPGVAIFSTEPGNTYGFKDGTSMATPMTAGAIAAFWDANPDFSFLDVMTAVKTSVRKIPPLASTTSTGGVINLLDLMEQGRLPVYATGAGEDGGPHVKVYRGRARFVTEFMAYSSSFTGGVRVATGDVNGDGYTDVVTVPGAGGGPHVKVFDGRTFKEIYSFYAFEPTFFGGLFVATGDVNGDGRADIIVSADRGGGPRVSVFAIPTGATSQVRIADFFAYDPAFTGGVRVAAGTFTAGSKRADVVTTPGFGGGPHVKVFRSADLLAGKTTAALQTISGDVNDRNGLFVTAADFTNDGIADVVTGTGAGNPVVRVHDGRNMAVLQTLAPATGSEIPGLVNPGSPTLVGTTNPPNLPNGLIPPGTTPDQLVYQAGQVKPGSRVGYMYGVRVAAQDLTGDKRPDLILAGGPNTAPTVSLVNGVTFAEFRNYSPYADSFFGGVYVGGAGI